MRLNIPVLWSDNKIRSASVKFTAKSSKASLARSAMRYARCSNFYSYVGDIQIVVNPVKVLLPGDFNIDDFVKSHCESRSVLHLNRVKSEVF